MSDVEKYASLKHSRFGQKLIFIGIAAFVTMAILFTWMLLYPIRNSKPDEVAIRFVRNNEIIKSAIGEITNIIGFGQGLEITNRSQEIARKLQNGEKLSEINHSKVKDNQVVLVSDGYGSWNSGKLIGSKRTIEVSLYLRKHLAGEFGNSFYYTVTEAKYKDESGEWKNIPIGWLENYFLLYK